MRLGNLLINIGLHTGQFMKGIQSCEKELKRIPASLQSIYKMGNVMSQVGKRMTLGITVPVAIMGNQIMQTAFEFEQAMANTRSVIGQISEEEFAQLEQKARDMGKTTIYSATTTANAMYSLAQAGWKTDQIIAGLDATMKYAAATQTDLSEATDFMVSSITVFGLEASDATRVANTYANACADSLATTEKLQYSMKYAGPIAASLGMSIEETTAALMVLYQQGYEGEMAGTILRNSLKALLTPTSAAEDALKEMGLTIDDVNPNMHSFDEILDTLKSHGITAAQAFKIFGSRAGPGMMAFLKMEDSAYGAGQAIRDFTAGVSEAGAVDEMFDTQMDTTAAKWQIMKNNVQELSISMGEELLPIIEDLLKNYIMPMVQWFSNLDGGTKELIIIMVGLAAVLGPILWFLGTIMTIIPGLIGLWEALAIAEAWTTLTTEGLTIASWGLMIPWIWIIAIIIAVVAVLWLLYDNWDAVCSFMQDVVDGLVSFCEDAFNVLKDVMLAPIRAIITMVNILVDALNSLSFTVPDWIPLFGGQTFGFNLPHVPMLGDGGIVTGPTLALIGEKGPEKVTPLDDAGPQGATFYVTIKEVRDGRETAKQLQRVFKAHGVGI